MFAIETFIVFWISCKNPILNLEETHLNSRMSLLTLIIIGEGVISITKLVNRIVGRSGWTTWSLIHIFGVSTALVCLPGHYYYSVEFILIPNSSIFCGSRISIFLLDKRLAEFGSVCG